METSPLPIIVLASRDSQLVYLIQRYADNCGCQLFQTDGGVSTIGTTTNRRPDVIFLDVSRTNPEGRLALLQLKSQPEMRFIPVILCATSEMDWQGCEAEGRLLQPILFNDFVNAIAETGIQIPRQTKEVPD